MLYTIQSSIHYKYIIYYILYISHTYYFTTLITNCARVTTKTAIYYIYIIYA